MKKNVLALVLGSAMTVSMGMSAFAESTTEAATEAAPGVMKAAEGATIEEIPTDFTTIQEGKLLVATSPDFAPYEFYSVIRSWPALIFLWHSVLRMISAWSCR